MYLYMCSIPCTVLGIYVALDFFVPWIANHTAVSVQLHTTVLRLTCQESRGIAEPGQACVLYNLLRYDFIQLILGESCVIKPRYCCWLG